MHDNEEQDEAKDTNDEVDNEGAIMQQVLLLPGSNNRGREKQHSYQTCIIYACKVEEEVVSEHNNSGLFYLSE